MLAVVLLLMLAGVGLGRWVIRSNYYVAEYSGIVALMRGIQGSLLGMSLNEPYLVGCLSSHNELSLINYRQSGEQLNCHVMRLRDLPPPERAQVQGVIPAGSLDEAEAQLRTLSAKALLPCPAPRATSPPADASGTPEPTASPLPTSSTPSTTANPTGNPPSAPNTPPAAPATTSQTATLPPPPQQPGVDCRAAA